MTHSLYRLDTGELTGVRVNASPEILALNTPPGCAWVEGAHDPRRAVVSLITDDFGLQLATVQPRTPPRPADNAYQAWAWDEAAADWRASPTPLARQATARAARDRLLAGCDWVTARAFETATPVPEPWATYRAALRDLSDQPGFPESITWPTPPNA